MGFCKETFEGLVSGELCPAYDDVFFESDAKMYTVHEYLMHEGVNTAIRLVELAVECVHEPGPHLDSEENRMIKKVRWLLKALDGRPSFAEAFREGWDRSGMRDLDGWLNRSWNYCQRVTVYCEPCDGHGLKQEGGSREVQPDTVECPHCLELGICPQCGKRNLTLVDKGDHDIWACTDCPWKEGGNEDYF